MLLKLRLAEPVLGSIEIRLAVGIDGLFYLFVDVHDREAKIVP